LKKNNEAEYITRVEHISEKCRFCDERLELVVKDMKPDFNITVFHTKCYGQWLKDIKEFGRRQGMREGARTGRIGSDE